MTQLLARLLLPLAALALLGGCAAEGIRPPSEAKRPVVEPLVRLHAVAFAPGSAQLTSGEAQRLTRFVAGAAPQPGDPLLVELPTAGPVGSLAERRASAIATHLAALGLPSRGVALPETGGDLVRVAIETVAVHAPEGCPDWQQPGLADGFGNGVAGNFGCATAANFAAMLERPRDALEGRATGPAPAARLTTRVRLFDAGVPLVLPESGGSTGGAGGGSE